MLYIVPTPIGNLKDITLRALEVLQAADAVICEDSRHTGLLLNHFQIKKPLIILNDYNESRVFASIVDRLKLGQTLALVSDAGTPLIFDPGFKLVRECLAQKIAVDSLPGPSSLLPAVTLSGLPPDKIFFLGYLPEKPGKRQEALKNLPQIYNLQPTTFVALVAPHKLKTTLSDMLNVYGNIIVVVAKELTKIHQSVYSQPLSAWLEEIQKNPPKGEYILLFNFPPQ